MDIIDNLNYYVKIEKEPVLFRAFFKRRYNLTLDLSFLDDLIPNLSKLFQSNMWEVKPNKILVLKAMTKLNDVNLTFIDDPDFIALPKLPFYLTDSGFKEAISKLSYNLMIGDHVNTKLSEKKFLFRYLVGNIESKKLITSLTEVEQLMIADSLYKLRHDLICHCIYNHFGIANLKESRFSEFYPFLPSKWGNKTPDIIIRNDFLKIDTIIEIVVSTQPNKNYEKKNEKYQEIINHIKSNTPSTINFYVVSLHQNLKNIYSCLNDLNLKVIPSIVNFALNNYGNINDFLQKLGLGSRLFANQKDIFTNPEIIFEPKKELLDFEMAIARSIELTSGQVEDFLDKASIRDDTLFYDGIPNTIPQEYIPRKDKVEDIKLAYSNLEQNIENNYERLITPKPTLHFLLDPEVFEYPNIEDKSSKLREEELVLLFFHENEISYSEEPCFEFLRLLSQKSKEIDSEAIFRDLFIFGKPEPKLYDGFLNSEFNPNYKEESETKQVELATKLLDEVAFDPDQVKVESETNNIKNNTGFKKKTRKQNKQLGLIKYLQSLNKLDKKSAPSLFHKAFKMNIPYYNSPAFDFYKSSGIRAKYYKNFYRTIKKNVKTLDLDPNIGFEFDVFYNSLSLENSGEILTPDYLFNSSMVPDHPEVMLLKERQHKDANPILKIMLKTNAAHLAYRYHLFAEQLIFLSSFQSRQSNYYIFSTGLKNIFCCLAGYKSKTGSDQGAPFFFFGTVPINYFFSPIFGVVYYKNHINNPQKKIFCSNWRRLKQTKLTFISDVFFSTLSSGFNDLFMTKISNPLKIRSFLKEFYIIRILSGLNTSQKIAEILSDFKYVLFGSMSIYARTADLLCDKFKPPYSSHLEVWVVRNFFRVCHNLINILDHPDLIKMNVPEFENDDRVIKSIGGTIKIPGLWSNCVLKDFNLFLNSSHTYVHTNKEPNSIHHESIKALNTILKFKGLYEEMSEEHKFGTIDLREMSNFLEKGKNMGFHAGVLNYFTKIFLKDHPLNIDKILAQEKFNIPISNFSSTKASISSFNRDLESEGRNKVHDLMIINTEKSIDDFNIKRTLAEHSSNFFKNNLNVLSDICIKEQYGPKREFYVLDISSKFLIKFLEEIFKSVCQTIPSECISVPGDMKLLKIQSLTNKSVRQASRRKANVYYINGDCSKWSASELMECLGTLIFSLKEWLPKSLYYLLLNIILKWQDKFIQIPGSVVKNSSISSEKTEYLEIKDGHSNVYRLKLKQNFLMGIFNYLSSFKASVCYYSSKIILEKKFKMKMNHVQHSDDYLMSIICNKSDLKDIKIWLNIFMRFCNITDSIKKTYVSQWIAEFVSLYSFNSHITYPQIKKTKEISSALTGFGYVEDTGSVVSRTTELLRIGCCHTSSLIFHKIHNWRLQRLYSLGKGQRNSIQDLAYLNPFEVPTEMFGLTECYPLLYLISSGDPNNLRLFKYSQHKELLNILDVRNTEEMPLDDIEGTLSMIKPKFVNTMKSKKLQHVLKDINFDFEESKKFLQDHASYKYIKPNFPDYGMPYLKSFYTLNQFKLAYMRNSRLSMLKRTSKFVSKNCVNYPKLNNDPLKLNSDQGQSIVSILIKLKNLKCVPIPPFYEMKEEFLCNADTAPLIFYNYLSSCDIIQTPKDGKVVRTVANISPFYYEPIKIDTPLNLAIQYTFNPTDFELDKRRITKNMDLELDKIKLLKVADKLVNFKIHQKVDYLYNYISSGRKKIRAIMSPFKERRDILTFINGMLRYQSLRNRILQLDQRSNIEFKNPFSNHFEVFEWKGEILNYTRAVILSTMTVYTILRFKEKQNSSWIWNYLNKWFLEKNNQNLFEFLETINLNSLEFYKFHPNEISSFLYMKADLLGDFDDLKIHSSRYTSSQHRYIKRANLTMDGVYKGDTIVEMAYFNSMNLGVWLESEKEQWLVSNNKNTEKSLYIFNMMQKLLQKERSKKYFLDEILNILKKLKRKSIEMQSLLSKVKNSLDSRGINKDNLKILASLNNDLSFVQAKDLNKNFEFYPIFYLENFIIREPLDLSKSNNKHNLVIEHKSGTLKAYPGNWTIIRFGFNDLYCDAKLFKDYENIKFCGIYFKAARNVDFFYNLLLKPDTFEYQELKEIIIRDEIPSVSCVENDFNINVLNCPQVREYKDELSKLVYKRDFPSLVDKKPEVIRKQMESDEESSDSEPFKMDVAADLSKLGVLTLDFGDSSDDDSNLDEILDSEDGQPLRYIDDLDIKIDREEGFIMIRNYTEKNESDIEFSMPFFLRRLKTTENCVDQIIENLSNFMYIRKDTHEITKLFTITFLIFQTLYPEPEKVIKDNYLKMLYNKIHSKMENANVYKEVEIERYLGVTLRFVNEEIVIYKYYTGILKQFPDSIKELSIINFGAGGDPTKTYSSIEIRLTSKACLPFFRQLQTCIADNIKFEAKNRNCMDLLMDIYRGAPIELSEDLSDFGIS
jgi:hypothetical protein